MPEARREPEIETAEETRLEPAVVARLYIEHAEELRRFLQGVLRNADLVADALQMTFVRAIEVGHLAQTESLKGWLFRVAYNEAMLVRRRQGVHDRATRRLAWNNRAGDRSPSDQLAWSETVDRVRDAIAELPPEQQAVVRSRIYEEKTFAAIAEETGLPLGTVLSRMHLALGKLRKRLKV
jgi:RNA polymerase sigma-70 factor (ECF subfamily)